MELLRHLEDRARARLDPAVYDYFAGGAGDERSLGEAQEAWQRHWLVPRVLRGVAAADLAVEVAGTRMAAPIVLAPAAVQRLLHPDGELAVARAAASRGLVSTLSTRSTADLQEVADAAPGGARWFQLYVEDRATMPAMVRRAAAAGYDAIVLTVDMPVGGRRERERRHGPLAMPPGTTVTTHLGPEAPGADSKPPVGGWLALGWEDVAEVAAASGLGVLVKGILSPADGEQAVRAGAAGVIVSTHGARQLDGAVPSAVALEGVAAAVAGRVPVLVDGGIRSGADVCRALALGADAVLVGRPYLWGLAADGQAGVEAVLDALLDDLERTLVLLGVGSPSALERSHLLQRPA